METEKKGKEVQTNVDKNRQNQTGNNVFRQDFYEFRQSQICKKLKSLKIA